MSYITKTVAAQIEHCFQQSHKAITDQYQGRILELNGGAAFFSGFDSYFSQVVGWGFNSKPSQFKSEINTIEAFYAAFNHTRVDIELCPFVGNDLAVFLSQRGYKVSELNNVSVLDLTAYTSLPELGDDWIIKKISGREIGLWAKAVALGFDCLEAQEQFIHYAKANNITAFGVYHLDKLIAGGTLAIHGEICDLAVTSTLPAYRGKGIQKRLIDARLQYAKSQGVGLAVVTTEPGSISDTNIQKVGFRCAYTRIKMTLEEF